MGQSLEIYTLEAGLFHLTRQRELKLHEPTLRLPLVKTVFLGRAVGGAEDSYCEGADVMPIISRDTDPHYEATQIGIPFIFQPRVAYTGRKIVFPSSRQWISATHGAIDCETLDERVNWHYIHRSKSGSQTALWEPGSEMRFVTDKGERLDFGFGKQPFEERYLLFGFIENYLAGDTRLPYNSGYVHITRRTTTTYGDRSTTFSL
ncbi:hypothetical protein HYV86_06710 [Candidatus Woesearchaeota archaeon]|nr:hypothetical protein [Candidatus Woesearchaeota archaeon]